MKKQLSAVLLVLSAAFSAEASTLGDFQALVNGANLKPFARDLGGVLGGCAFHSGRALGFPGFDVGVVGTIQSRPDKDNTILRGAGVKAFGLPLIQAEVGLPLNFDVIVHGISGQGARIMGGGIRYGIHKSGMLSVLPNVAISAFGDKVSQTFFNATHYSINAMASFSLPVIHPYVGAGADFTKVTVGGANLPAVVGTSQKAQGSRLTAGIDLSPLPFIHLFGAYTLLHGISGADAGLGVRF